MVGKFSAQRCIWKTETTSLKRLISSARQMPQVLGRGQQKGGGARTGNCSHSSMSGVVRRCPPHGDNCSRKTSSPGGHWSLADGWAATCPSYPSPGSLSEECTCHMEIPQDSAQTTSFSVSQKGCHRIFVLTEGVPQSNKVWGKLQATSHAWRFTGYTACGEL